MESIETYLQKSINNDIFNLLFSLEQKYNKNNKFTLDELVKRYMANLKITNSIIFKKKPNTIKKKYNPHNIPISLHRCTARCWGGEDSVKYNPITKKWSYGTRCKRYRIYNSNFCKTHDKKYRSVKGLSHGVYNLPPPHPHYLKYKSKIETKYKIKN